MLALRESRRQARSVARRIVSGYPKNDARVESALAYLELTKDGYPRHPLYLKGARGLGNGSSQTAIMPECLGRNRCRGIERHRRLVCAPPHSITFVEPLRANSLEDKCEFMRFGIDGWDGTNDPEIALDGNLDIHIAVKEIPVPRGEDIGILLATTASDRQFEEFLA